MQGWIQVQTRRGKFIRKSSLPQQSRAGSHNVPVQNRVESDQSDLSEDEQCVLQVPLDQKGEFVCDDISGSSKLPVQSCQVRGRHFGKRLKLQNLS